MRDVRFTGKCEKGQDSIDERSTWEAICRPRSNAEEDSILTYRSSGSSTKDSCGFGGASEFLPGSAESADLASPAAFALGGGSSGPLTPQPAIPAPAAPISVTISKDFELRRSAAM